MNAESPQTPPSDTREVLYWKITGSWWRVLAVNVLGLVFLMLTSLVSFWWASLWHPVGAGFTWSGLDGLWLLVSLLFTVIIHELLHGLAIRLFGGKPAYGFVWKGLMFYATAAGHPFKRNHYIGVALAPLVLGSLAGMILLALPLAEAAVWIIALCAALNAAGAVGDLWIMAVVLRYPSWAYVVDERDGMRVYLPAAEQPGPTEIL